MQQASSASASVPAAALYFVREGQWLLALVLFAVANLAITSTLAFYNALLPGIAGPEEVDRVSTAGFALGYLGGGLAVLGMVDAEVRLDLGEFLLRDDGEIEIWGDGTAMRAYTYVDDMVDGIYRLMHSELHGAVNIGCPQYVTVRELVDTVAEAAGKKISVKSIPGPVGVQSRNFSNERIYSIGWRSQFDLRKGIEEEMRPYIDQD